ncbi:hypothetical protein [Pseudomonas sp. nanlin1]|uniref:hypothetical protein n=1 Tax=Pseudomonas sp. nanlin1 TaxID=3040605 RepID=UPI0038908BAD
MPTSFMMSDTNLYEAHYVVGHSKKVLLIERKSMNELDSWLCVILYASGGNINISTITDLDHARQVAMTYAIEKVRWNKTDRIETQSTSICFYGDTWQQSIFTLSKPESV